MTDTTPSQSAAETALVAHQGHRAPVADCQWCPPVPAPTTEAAAQGGYAVMFGYVVQEFGKCNCATPGGEYGHEAGCGWEPVIPVALLTDLGFAVVPPGHIVVPAPWCAFLGQGTNADRCREVADRIEGNTLPGSNSRDMVARLLRDSADAMERMGVVLDVDPETDIPVGGVR